MNPRPYSVHTLHHVPCFQLESREMMATGDSGSIFINELEKFPKIMCENPIFSQNGPKIEYRITKRMQVGINVRAGSPLEVVGVVTDLHTRMDRMSG